MTSRAWVVLRKPHTIDCMKVFLAKGIVAIGWPELNFSGLGRDSVEKRLKAYSNSRNVAKDLNVVWYFVREMEKGDLVLVPEAPDVHVGKVISGYLHDARTASKGLPYPNQREVTWLNGSPFSKSRFPTKVQRTLKAQSPPVLRLDATANEIRACIAGSKSRGGHPRSPKKDTHKSTRSRPVGFKDETESTSFRKAAEINIRAIHKKLINAFNSHVGHRVRANENTYDIFIDQGWYPGRTLLIEAKSQARGGAGRQQIREAIGQLFDYRLMLKREGHKNIDLALLTPEKPDRELIDLVHRELRMEIVWQTRSGFRGTKGVDKWLRQ